MSLGRDAIGLVAAPLPVVVPVTLLHAVILLDQPSDGASVIASWLDLVLFSYLGTLLIGIPVHVALQRLGRRNVRAYLIVTTLAVLVTVAMIAVMDRLMSQSPENNPFGMTLWSGFGIVTVVLLEASALAGAWIFWRVAICRPRQTTSVSSDTAGA